MIAPTVYQDMLAAQKSGKQGAELFSSFGIDEQALQSALEGLLKRVIFRMFDWNEGTFSFVLEDSPDIWRGFSLEAMRVVVESGLNPQYLAIEGARLRDERTQEDSLESFLARDKPSAQARLEQSAESVQKIAAQLRTDENALATEAETSFAKTAAEVSTETATAAPPLAKPRPPAAGVRSGGEQAQPARVPEKVSVEASPSEQKSTPRPVERPSESLPAPVTPAAARGDQNIIPFPAQRVRRDGGERDTGEKITAKAPEYPSLPMPAAPAPIVPAPLAAPESPRAAGGQAVYRLLAVDDDPQVTKHIKASLAGSFVEVLTADTVQDAFDAIEAGPDSLVVASDLIIARSDGRGILGGVEILERVRERWPKLPVLLFTDYRNEEAEAKAQTLGVVAILTKPRKAQVQAAAKEGRKNPMADFIEALGTELSTYLASAAAALASAAPTLAEPDKPRQQQPIAGPPPPAPSLPNATQTIEQPVALGSPVGTTTAAPKAYDLGSEIAREIGDLASPFEDDLPPEVTTSAEMATLRSMLAELIDPANRDTITLLVLRFASHIVERAALFLATRRAYVGLGGFSAEESSDHFVSRVRKIQIAVDKDSVFGKVTRFRSMIRGPLKELDGNRRLIEGLGGVWPKEATVAAPLISGDRVAAILYCDNPSGKSLGYTESLEIFLQQAGLAMDRALLERKLEDSRKKQGGQDGP